MTLLYSYLLYSAFDGHLSVFCGTGSRQKQPPMGSICVLFSRLWDWLRVPVVFSKTLIFIWGINLNSTSSVLFCLMKEYKVSRLISFISLFDDPAVFIASFVLFEKGVVYLFSGYLSDYFYGNLRKTAILGSLLEGLSSIFVVAIYVTQSFAGRLRTIIFCTGASVTVSI